MASIKMSKREGNYITLREENSVGVDALGL